MALTHYTPGAIEADIDIATRWWSDYPLRLGDLMIRFDLLLIAFFSSSQNVYNSNLKFRQNPKTSSNFIL